MNIQADGEDESYQIIAHEYIRDYLWKTYEEFLAKANEKPSKK